MGLEKDLKTIKDAELDIELLRRQNETLCRDNDFKIGELNVIIGTTEKVIEEELKASGEKKLECKIGYCSFRTMPDKWEYMDSDIIAWCKKEDKPYYKTLEVVKKFELKKDILAHLCEDDVPGITVTPQEPKFNYKIKR